MISKNIYISTKECYESYNFTTNRYWRSDGKYEPFVYIIYEESTGMSYIGAKFSKNCKEVDLGTKYFTSSRIIDWKKNLDSFKILEIIRCGSNHDAIILERILIEKHNAVYSNLFYNQAHPNIGFNGGKRKMFTAIDKDGNKFFIDNDDPRFLSGELFGLRKGKTMPNSFKDQLSNRMLGTISVKDKNGNNFIIDKNDPRYIKGELVPIGCGIKFTQERKDNISRANKEAKSKTDNSIPDNVRKKISNTLKGVKKSESHRQKIAESNKNMSDETKKKISESRKGIVFSNETLHKMSLVQIGKKQSKETKDKKSKHFSNTVWINNGDVNKRVLSSILDEYIEYGWRRGKVKRNKD